MDSHVFRLVAAELSRLLRGARVEKIHGPVPDVYVFTLFALKAKVQLTLRCERQSPLLFFATRRLSNPPRPPARVMRLRKYCAGRRLGPGTVDFATRRIAFPVGSFPLSDDGAPGYAPASPADDAVRQGQAPAASADEHPAIWLLLDLRDGVDVVFSLPPGFGGDPVWPEAAMAESLCDRPWSKKETGGPWQDYAVLTPFLRETLAGLDVMEGRALLVDLEAGGGELFSYADASGRLSLYSAWPLPEAVLRRRGLAFWREESHSRDDRCVSFAAAGERPEPEFGRQETGFAAVEQREGDTLFQREFPALALVSRVDEARFFAEFGLRLDKEEQQPRRRETKRVVKLLAKLDQEETRLKGLAELRGDARLLRSVLWQYPAEVRLDSVDVPVDAEEGGGIKTISLDPLLTLRENMARMFHASARGARGLEHLKRRRAEVLGETSEATETADEEGVSARAAGRSDGGVSEASGDPSRSGRSAGLDAEGSRPSGPRPTPEPAQTTGQQGSREGREAKSIKNVARFRSSDGFTLLRGKNAQGNQSLLKLGQPHDLWLHALDGPSAHLVIRRSHAGEDIPETTLFEAAVLVGEKSWQRHDAKARIMVALLRHVRAIKGAAPGTVKVDAILRTITVALDGKDERSQE